MPPPSPSPSADAAAAVALADERARRRAALLASCEEADRREEAEQSCKLEKARKDAEAAGVTQAEGRAWMDAAKQGQVATLTAMIKENERVLAYRGQGTSYSLMGHTALHWVCAKGHVQAAKMLIDSGLDANAVNNGGTHALFSAAAHGQASTARFLLVYGKCNAKLHALGTCFLLARILISQTAPIAHHCMLLLRMGRRRAALCFFLRVSATPRRLTRMGWMRRVLREPQGTPRRHRRSKRLVAPRMQSGHPLRARRMRRRRWHRWTKWLRLTKLRLTTA